MRKSPISPDRRTVRRTVLAKSSMAVGSVFLALSLAGCSSERAFGAYDWKTHTWKTPTGIKVEDRVSGKLIDPASAITLEYRGDLYYFQNEFDVEMFKRDPGVYDYHGYAPNYGGGP